MTNLKEQLIKLGSTNPELRYHLRPVLATLEKTALKPLRVNSQNQIHIWIGGPMNRDHRIGDPIPKDAEWRITHNSSETTITTKGLSGLRSEIEKAANMKIEDSAWKDVVTLIERGDTAKMAIQLPSIEVYN